MTYPTEKANERLPDVLEQRSEDYVRGLKDARDRVVKRKHYYELFRRREDLAEPQMMTTHPAVFTTLDEVILFISSMIERAERGLTGGETVHDG